MSKCQLIGFGSRLISLYFSDLPAWSKNSHKVEHVISVSTNNLRSNYFLCPRVVTKFKIMRVTLVRKEDVSQASESNSPIQWRAVSVSNYWANVNYCSTRLTNMSRSRNILKCQELNTEVEDRLFTISQLWQLSKMLIFMTWLMTNMSSSWVYLHVTKTGAKVNLFSVSTWPISYKKHPLSHR